MEGGPGPTMWTTGPGRPALGAWKVGAGQQGSLARGTEGGHMWRRRCGTLGLEGGDGAWKVDP
jgi:hypothetical protein